MKIERFVRSSNQFASSYQLQNLDVSLSDGSVLELIFKNVAPAAMLPAARKSKQARYIDPARELTMYANVLADRPHGTAACVGVRVDRRNDKYWLFLERVPGLNLSFVGNPQTWLGAVRWLARFHSDSIADLDKTRRAVPLIEYSSAYYRQWCRRTCTFVSQTKPKMSSAMRQLDSKYTTVTEKLLSLPQTLIHGDFYPANVLVRNGKRGLPAICPVDWELTAAGPGLVDLASITAGKWSEQERRTMLQAYWTELPSPQRSPWRQLNDLEQDLKYCRLHLAVQWVGWSRQWKPPKDQKYDWFKEMITLASELNLL